MKAHAALMQDSGKTRLLSPSISDEARFFSQNRIAPLSFVFGLHLILLGWLMTQAPVRQVFVRLMPVSVIGLPLTKIVLPPVPVLPSTSSAADYPISAQPPATTRTAPVPQTLSPLTRFDEHKSVTPVTTIERDFPANALPVLDVPNPVTEQRGEMAQSGMNAAVESEKNETARIGEMDNNVIVITKLGSSKAEYIAPNFLQAQLEQTHFQVEVGDFEDIETALVNQIITQIRGRYKKEIFWNSKIKARMVRLSMLPQDHAALEKFLKMEIFGKKQVRDYSFWDKSKF